MAELQNCRKGSWKGLDPFPSCNSSILQFCNAMIHYRADWVLPISGPPMKDGWIAVDGDRIAGLSSSAPRRLVDPIDLGRVAVLPGLVNAHTHLELSYLRGRIPASSSFIDWIRDVIGTRRRHPATRAPEILGAVHAAIAEAV